MKYFILFSALMMIAANAEARPRLFGFGSCSGGSCSGQQEVVVQQQEQIEVRGSCSGTTSYSSQEIRRFTPVRNVLRRGIFRRGC